MKLILKLALIALCINSLSTVAYAEPSSAAKSAETAAPSTASSKEKTQTADDDKDRKKETWKVGGSDCSVVYDEPVGADQEATTLFSMCRNGFEEEITGQLDKRAAELDDSFCINFAPEGKPVKIITGKEAALEAMKKEATRFADHPPNRIVFAYPFAKAYGDSAIVTYKCIVVGRGDDPLRMSGYVTNMFLKRGDQWKQVERSSHWKVTNRPGSHSATTGGAEKTPTAAPTPSTPAK